MPVKLNSSGGGSVTLTTPSTATDYTATFPASTGNVLLSSTAVNQSTTGPTVTNYTSGSGTYTVPAGVKWLRVRMIGGGGGGGSSGSSGAAAGGTGGTTTFGSSFLTCTGGGGGSAGGTGFQPSAGGTATGGDINATGQFAATSQAANASVGNIYNDYGTNGGNSIFGTAGYGGTNGGGSGSAASSNSGAGGGAAGGLSGYFGAVGGSAGGYLEKIISSPSATYSYAVGAGGTAATAGTGGGAGGAGGAGFITIEEHYNY